MNLDIMLPFYGRFDHLVEAVESVRAQTDPNWRLVIIDDQYPDPAPGEWAAARAAEDPRIEYRRNEKNLRISGNFNESIRLMESEHAIIMGCDDVLLPGYVAHVRALTQAYPDVSIIQPGVSIIDGEGEPSSPLADRIKYRLRPAGTGTRVAAGEELVTGLLRGNWLYFPSLVWRVEELKKRSFRTDYEVVEDLVMVLEIIEDGGTLLIDEDPVVFHYRRHATSVSSKRGPDGKKFIEERELFHDAAERARALGWHKARRTAQIRFTSRANALTELPSAIRVGSGDAIRSLLRHALGS
ncbi:glycosyltransferase [Mycetocola lacteus]|uniref:Glycosyltransferase n=1 Tax=Mycetocola lacteus TaxID=76637 RepID=A0A3L7AKB2_9MICO|nr:glycosyltransferase [Mycetocola lacteus]RLP79812.1 glycosyltransferase [Mycetocola lacteus]